MRRGNRISFAAKSLEIGILFLFLATSLSSAVERRGLTKTGSDFRWIQPTSDPQLWTEIESSFRDELAPDKPKPGQSELDTYTYKHLQKVGVLDHSALVIIGHQPAKQLNKGDSWDLYSSAFNFDLTTRKISVIEKATWMWQWKFHELAIFGPAPVPDVTFTYLTCTECEPELMFSSLYYDAQNSAWQVRSWGNGKDIWWAAPDGLVVETDIYGGNDTIGFDCVYGAFASNSIPFDNFAIRCKEATYPEKKGRAKIDDATLLYDLSGGQFKPQRIGNPPDAISLTTKLCKSDSQSLLCKVLAYSRATSDQNGTLDSLFPTRRYAFRDLANFRSLKRTMSMLDVARRCGEPDEVGAGEHGERVFIYHLDDGSLVAIGATGSTGPVLYARHVGWNQQSYLIPPK